VCVSAQVNRSRRMTVGRSVTKHGSRRFQGSSRRTYTDRMQKILYSAADNAKYFAFREARSKSFVFGCLKCKRFCISSEIFCFSTLLIKIPWILLVSLYENWHPLAPTEDWLPLKKTSKRFCVLSKIFCIRSVCADSRKARANENGVF
jgi:hypothetical protein